MTTYSQLLEDTISYVENRGAEYTAAFPRIAARAEERVSNDLGISVLKRETTTTTIAVISTPVPYVNLPANTDFVFSIGYSLGSSTNSTINYLKPRTVEYAQNYYPNIYTASSVPPQYYAITTKAGTTPEQLQILISPPISTTSLLYIATAQKLSGLSISNESTFLSEHFGDLLFKAILVESAEFHTDENAMALHMEQYKLALASAKVNSDTLSTDINVIR